MKFMENGNIDFRQETEGVSFQFSERGGAIQIISAGQCHAEATNVANAPYQLGLIEKKGIIIILIKFGCMPWMDMPYHISFSNSYELEDVNTSGYQINVYFIDKYLNTICFMRPIEMSVEISRRFRELVENQRTETIDYDTISSRVNQIYAEYSTTDLVKLAGIG